MATKKNTILGLMLIIFPIGLLGTFVLFFYSNWSQLAYWPYEYPSPLIPPIRLVFYLSLGLFVVLIPLLIKKGIDLQKQIPIFTKWKGMLKKVGQFFIFIILLGSIGGSVVLGYFAGQSLPSRIYDSNPYLTWDSDQDPSSAITVCWRTKGYSESDVQYGLSASTLTMNEKESKLTQFHQVAISGLIPNTTYFYRAGNNVLKQFTTAPLGPHNFTFTMWSDPRTNNPLEGALKGANLPQIMSEQLAEQGIDAAFSICAGDITSRGVDAETWKLWLDDITTNDFASNRSHQVTFGNHERHDDITANNIPNYYPYDEAPLPASFSYSFDYGNVHFVMLDRWDQYNSWWNGNDTVHAEWLEQDLLAHSNRTFTILVMHPNPILGDAHSGQNQQIMKVAEDNGVNVIFCGHWHSYHTYYFNGSALFPENVVDLPNQMVMMMGVGGNSENLDYGGYCQVDVSPTSLVLRPRWVDGTWGEPFVFPAT